MTGDRAGRLDTILEAALARPPEAREAFVREACGADAALADEVRSLLAHAASADGFLEPAATDRPAPLEPGQMLGPYEVGPLIGAGGMGEVYRARDTRLNRIVAIKMLPDDAADDPGRLKRFEREARAVAALSHPNICALHDIGCESPRRPSVGRGTESEPAPRPVRFLVMEYLEGETLAQRLRRGPLPLGVALECGAQIADALARAHGQGITHRDLKPANIMLLKGGARAGVPQVKLLDFGLAGLNPSVRGAASLDESAATPTVLTRPGMMMGTVPYMAPEQLEGKQTDARTDLFAFGAVLYEMLTARRAFEGASQASIISAIMSSEPPPLSELQPLTPPALDRLVRSCLSKDPDGRWQHAADVAEALRGISADSVPAHPTRAAGLRRPAWRGAFIGVVAAALLVAAAWFAAGWLRPRSSVPARFAVTMPGAAQLDSGSAMQTLTVSRDGTAVVYEAMDEPDASYLAWSSLNGEGEWPLASTENARNPFLSPDGGWLGFWRKGKIHKVQLQSGRIVEGSVPVDVAVATSVRGASWGDDGTIVYSDGASLWRVASDGGGEPHQLIAPDASECGGQYRFPVFLPGGRQVLFTALDGTARADRGEIRVLSLDTLEMTTVVRGGVYGRYLPSGHLVYASNGTLFAVSFDAKSLRAVGDPAPVLNDVYLRWNSNNAGFDVAADGTLVYAEYRKVLPSNHLMWVTRDGRAQPAVAEGQAYGEFALSPDGQRLAVGIEKGSYINIWIYDFRDGRWLQLREEADSTTPLWSPAGDRLAFQSNRDCSWNLYVARADGEGQPERLTRSTHQQWPLSWSRDDVLAYLDDPRGVNEGEKPGVFILPLTPVAQPWPWAPGKTTGSPAFSPDGKWLAYGAMESGRRHVFVRAFPGPGPRHSVSGPEGGSGPVWSPESNAIYFMDTNNRSRILVRQVESTSPLRLGALSVAFSLPFELPENPFAPRFFAVAPGGQRVLALQPAAAAEPRITAWQVVRHWTEDVRAKLSGK